MGRRHPGRRRQGRLRCGSARRSGTPRVATRREQECLIFFIVTLRVSEMARDRCGPARTSAMRERVTAVRAPCGVNRRYAPMRALPRSVPQRPPNSLTLRFPACVGVTHAPRLPRSRRRPRSPKSGFRSPNAPASPPSRVPRATNSTTTKLMRYRLALLR